MTAVAGLLHAAGLPGPVAAGLARVVVAAAVAAVVIAAVVAVVRRGWPASLTLTLAAIPVGALAATGHWLGVAVVVVAAVAVVDVCCPPRRGGDAGTPETT